MKYTEYHKKGFKRLNNRFESMEKYSYYPKMKSSFEMLKPDFH